MRVILIRHGETDFNKNHRLQGSLDIPLNEKGKEQSLKLLKRLSTLEIDKIFCSNLIRARDTIEPFLKSKGNITCEYYEELQENCLGKLNGLTWEEINLKLKEENKTLDDYGENKKKFISRIMKFWKKKIIPIRNEISTLIVITHGGYIVTLVSHLVKLGFLDIPEGIKINGPPKNCSMSVIDIRDELLYDLLSYSDDIHLSS
ncbi:hypothetical protein PNEG_01461 [Pneumocystis murina B123]|uniref:Phosphoglycerate mutase n=1 Tax=Pneumocystis murina (strain B123) TaxID=1069680 RepID=M7NNB9_PNEMU|nr:hypothetical protein PNEG_01461 [Pneumocystis murina B123]EMR10188.1 hypothetical protein PNEG_01461 [Pneumocystis murina B123]